MARFAPRLPLRRRLGHRRVRRRRRVRQVRRRLGHRGVRLAAARGLGACLRQKLAPVEKIHPINNYIIPHLTPINQQLAPFTTIITFGSSLSSKSPYIFSQVSAGVAVGAA